MRTKILLYLTVISFVSCEAPKEKRANYFRALQDNNLNESAPDRPAIPSTETGNTDTNNDSGEEQPNSDNSSIPSEVSHCTWSTNGTSGFAYSSSHLGEYSLCQSSTSKSDIFIQLKNSITDTQICIFPTYDNDGKSFHIGNPRCFVATEGGKLYKITLYKDRGGNKYSGLPINSVMIMKDKAYFYEQPFYQWMLSPEAYTYCAEFLEVYQNPAYCQAFKAKGEYIYKKF